MRKAPHGMHAEPPDPDRLAGSEPCQPTPSRPRDRPAARVPRVPAHLVRPTRRPRADQVGGGPPLARPAPGRCRAGRQPRLTAISDLLVFLAGSRMALRWARRRHAHAGPAYENAVPEPVLSSVAVLCAAAQLEAKRRVGFLLVRVRLTLPGEGVLGGPAQEGCDRDAGYF